MRLKNQVAIITGGASGIGRATAELFLAEGARVAIVDWHDVDRSSLATPSTSSCEILRTYKEDVTDSGATDRIVDEIHRAWGTIDILVTSAAISIGKTVMETASEDLRRVLDVNVGGTFGWISTVLPVMIAKGSGSIVTVGSQLSTAGGKSNAAYVTSKGAIASLTKSVALDYAETGVRCNCVAPGGTATPLLNNAFVRSPVPEKAREELTARHAMKRLGRPNEIALAILFLASPESSFVTGTRLVVDGGWLAA